MHLPDLPLKLSWAIDHGHNGKEVKFYSDATEAYEREKHTHDHEDFMRKCDNGLFMIVAMMFYKSAKGLVESGSIKADGASTAIDLLHNSIQDLKSNRLTADRLAKTGNHVLLALGPLDPSHKQGADRNTAKAYKQLLNLALQIIWRYERITYNDIIE